MKKKMCISTCVVAIAALSLSTVQAATNVFAVVNSGFTGFTFNGGVINETITLVRGFTYVFNINTPGHPFYIKTTFQDTGNDNLWSDGVSGDVGSTSGTITFAVPQEAPDPLYYQCGLHQFMSGQLHIVDPPPINITGFSVGTNVVIQSTGTNILNVDVLTSPNLTTNTVWSATTIQSNLYASGTNTTHVALPIGDEAFFRVQQGFFNP